MDCVISLDGLGATDLDALTRLLPKSQVALGGFDCVSMHAGNLSGAQPIWAELLTGQSWHVNGCSAYAAPSDSLNKLKVFSERELACDQQLMSSKQDSAPDISVNVPLLRPSEGSRLWLSDGSLPINKLVSPSSLLSSAVFDRYRARPFTDMGIAQGKWRSAFKAAMEVEEIRLQCVADLLRERKYGRFVWRLSLFDHVVHLLGLHVLEAEDLEGFAEIKEFLHKFDEQLFLLLADPDVSVFIISPFSHEACRARLNLNELLQQGGWLEVAEAGRLDETPARSIRSQAVMALTGQPPGQSIMRSMEARLKSEKTIAASPTTGCIFLNSRKVFADGIVSDEDYVSTRQRLRNFLLERLSVRFGNSFSLEENPHPEPIKSMRLPEFIVRLPFVELHNMQENSMSWYDVPRSTHSPAGFLWLSKGRAGTDKIRPTQFVTLLNQ